MPEIRGRTEMEGHRPAKQPLASRSLFSVLCLLSSVFCVLSSSEAFEVKGLQPLAPFGVFSTFSAESLTQNHVDLGLTLERSKEPDFYRTLFQFAYGMHDKAELEMTLPYIAEWENRVDGFEDVSFGFKHRILDDLKYGPSIAYILTASVSSGSRQIFSTDGSLGGGLLITKKVGPFKGHLNLLYSSPQDHKLKDEYLLNVGSELAVTHNSKILAELQGRKNYYVTRIDLLEWRLGYRIATTENIFTTVGAGFNIKNRTPDYRLLFSVNFVLPKEKKDIQKVIEE